MKPFKSIFLLTALLLFCFTLPAQKNIGDWHTHSIQVYEQGVLQKQIKFNPAPYYTQTNATSTHIGEGRKKTNLILHTFNGGLAYFPVNKTDRIKIGTDYTPPPGVDIIRTALKSRNFYDGVSTLYLKNKEIIIFTKNIEVTTTSVPFCVTIDGIKYKELKIRHQGTDYLCLALCTTHVPGQSERGSFFFSSLKLPQA